MSEESGKRRNRRSFAQLLLDYKDHLAAFDAKVARQREKIVAKIDKLENRYSMLALGVEALDGRPAQEVEAELENAIKELQLRRRAVRRVAKTV
jgi:hypothetical protein